ncbi:MAG: FHA domain-containing protein [Thermodesulfobacteriota bacterium]|jgi:pSer/pThr/pTyr-binding forkhead associated (FHA) protein|nr:MAG: FHA domain-containing protein [Thermodesulfobacteriota bacterium]
MPKLILKFKEALLKEYALEEEMVTIGRVDDNTIKVDNMAVSSHHAKLIRENGDYVLIDLNSLNGTFVNGQKVSKWILKNNDFITIGKHTLVYIDERAPKKSPLSGTSELRSPEETVMLDMRTQQQLLEEAAAKKGVDKMGEFVGALTFISDNEGEGEIDLSKRITMIGKGKEAEIKIKGFFLPNISAVISRRPAGYFLSHSGGRAIPKANGESVKGQVKLKDGDIIEIAGLKMQFFLKPTQE